MMQKNREVSKYSRAIYDMAVKSDSIEKTLKSLNSLSLINSTSSEFRLFLQSRRIKAKDKIVILNQILSNVLSDLELDLLMHLIENDNIHLLNQIIQQYGVICEQDEKTVKVKITTAKELDSVEKNELLNAIENSLNKKVDLDNLVNPGILGGAQLRIGNMIIDGSIATRLEKLEKSLY
tara:strand:+ start:292 stop:828 length:537 start_codon:yes stop_codon:yes gene_type:complete